MPKFLKQLLAWFRDFGAGQGRSSSDFGLPMFGLAQPGNGARATGTGSRPNHYGGQTLNTKRHKFTGDEVKRILRGKDRGEHASQVMSQAATFSSLLDPRMIRYFRGRERIFERMPYVLFQYIQGKPCDEIADTVSFFSDGADVEDAMDFAARLIAYHLNRQRY